MKEPSVAELAKYENRSITAYFAVTAKQVRSKKDGAPYFSLTLADRTGQAEGVMWETSGAGEFSTGDIVKVHCQVGRYRDKIQLTLERIRVAEPGSYQLSDFVPSTVYNIDDLWARLNGYVASFTDPYLHALLGSFLDDPEFSAAFREAPAAKGMHHAWIGGLLEHVVSLLGIADLAAGHYPVHRDLLLTGAILHDIGKLYELRWGATFDYTLEGQLLGHITMGVNLIDKRIDAIPGFPPALRVLVEHIVLSHHGKYEFGSPKLPMIPEAILLHYLDDMDAKMQTIQSEFERTVAAGRTPGEMTDYVRAMERPLLDTKAFLAKSGVPSLALEPAAVPVPPSAGNESVVVAEVAESVAVTPVPESEDDEPEEHKAAAEVSESVIEPQFGLFGS
ncbi:3'-5' exoribonuclease YhaM family protein [Silvibacterium dinghuense]|uniref:HD domain-containing protein n=1 Tax=Silvibacterium dinghuense TaxID=1560006 RepID=A0A4V1NVP9_9BACT|nr:HD domain-containing protein [Silvibacterium dinghuense]RXS96682.1 HD domain-containing protein [Silvibacterium dinghuense]GGG92841.1 HD family phosphohydrolase [Silvibacterium dinghuense]